MPGAGTDKTKHWVAAAGAGGDPGRAAARREHRRGGARHGEFRAVAAAAGQAARRLAQPAGAQDGRPAPTASSTRRCFTTRWRRRSPTARWCSRPRRGRTIRPSPWSTPAEAARAAGAARSRPARRSASCSAASAIGLENHEVALADRDRHACRSIRPSPRSISAQAVLIVAYEWFKLATVGALPFAMPQKSPPATKQQLLAFFDDARARAGEGRVLPPARQARHHADQPAQHLPPHAADPAGHPTLHGVIMSIAEGRKGPARGGVLDGDEARAAAHAARRARRGPGAGRARRRCAGWRGSCAAIRPRPSACSGTR